MWDILLYSSVIFFVCFGVIGFFLFVADFFYETKYLKNKKIYMIIPFDDYEHSVEEAVRAVKFKAEKSGFGVLGSEIIFVCKDENKATYKAFKRAEKCIGGISVLKSSEMAKKLDFL